MKTTTFDQIWKTYENSAYEVVYFECINGKQYNEELKNIVSYSEKDYIELSNPADTSSITFIAIESIISIRFIK